MQAIFFSEEFVPGIDPSNLCFWLVSYHHCLAWVFVTYENFIYHKKALVYFTNMSTGITSYNFENWKF